LSTNIILKLTSLYFSYLSAGYSIKPW